MAENFVSNSYSKVEPEFLCDVCQVDGKFDNASTAVTFCVDCMDCLCTDCVDDHSRNEALKTHKTLAMEKFPSRLTPTMLQALKTITQCSVHEVQFDYICEDHGELICHLCTKKNHRSCTKIYKIQFSSESACQEVEKTRNRLQNIRLRRRKNTELCNETERQCKLRKNILKQIQSFLEQVDNSDEKNTIAITLETECQQTNLPSVVHEDDLSIHEERLLAVLDLDHDEKTVLVSKHIELSTTNQKNILKLDELIDVDEHGLSEISQNSERLLKLQDIVRELIGIPYISSHTSGSLDEKDSFSGTNAQPFIEVSRNIILQDNETDLMNSYAISSTDADIEPCDSTSRGPQNLNLKSVNVSTQTLCVPRLDREVQTGPEPTVVARLPLTRRDLEFIGSYNCLCYLDIHPHCKISGVVVLKSHRVVITDKLNRTIKVYDNNFQFQVASKHDCSPLDLCVANQDSETVAISFGTKRLQIYSIQANKIVYIRGIDLGLYCRGICSVSEDIVALLATSCKGLDKAGRITPLNESNTVEVQQRHISDGKICTIISDFDNEIRGPFYVQVGDDKNSIIIGEENQISTFNEYGDRTWYYRSSKHNRLNDVFGMTIDSEGNIYATGYGSDNVHQVSSQDYRCSRVVIPYIKDPISIEYDSYLERLIVGCRDSTCLSVYRFTNGLSRDMI